MSDGVNILGLLPALGIVSMVVLMLNKCEYSLRPKQRLPYDQIQTKGQKRLVLEISTSPPVCSGLFKPDNPGGVRLVK